MFEVLDDKFLTYGEEDKKIPRDLNFLIVDDDSDIRDLLEDSVKEMGFTGEHFRKKSVEDAVDFCQGEKAERIDFILCDWNLEGLSGLDFLIQVRDIQELKDTPFLMVTANDNVSGMLIATKKGCSDYLVKPFSLEELALKVIIAWEKHH